MKVAFVVQRYGAGVDGGSEAHCRAIAERLAPELDLEVWTSTARDYLTWANELPAGTSLENGVRVRRFPVASRRRVRSFGRLSERLYRTPHTLEDEIDWMQRQGPRVPALLDALRAERDRFDAFVFYTYLYYPTAFGLPLVCEKSVLVPTLHDEPPAHFALFHPVFHLPRAIIWNTPEERDTAVRLFRLAPEGEIGGIGIAPIDASRDSFRSSRGLGEYLLFLGRIDVFKGVPELLDHFARYRRERGGLELVLAGKTYMKIPRAEGVHAVGYLDETEKQEALAGALATVSSSSFESLSIVTLESWSAGTPVLATANGDVVAAQCRRSGGGLVYGSYEEFRDAVDRLRAGEARSLGEAGRRWTLAECGWPKVLDVYRRAIARAAGRPVS
jgi:glycosyltransferase involved in cell wall biosynthesis